MQNDVLEYFIVNSLYLYALKEKLILSHFGFKIKYIFYNDSVAKKTFYHCLRALEPCNLFVRKSNHHYYFLMLSFSKNRNLTRAL